MGAAEALALALALGFFRSSLVARSFHALELSPSLRGTSFILSFSVGPTDLLLDCCFSFSFWAAERRFLTFFRKAGLALLLAWAPGDLGG